MFSPTSFDESMLDIWCLLFFSLLGVCSLAWWQRSPTRGRSWRQLLRNQRGASYTLSVVVMLPFYLALLGIIMECATLLIAKTATQYAAFAACRAAIVWLPADLDDDRKLQRIHLAAVQSMAPFAHGNARLLTQLGQTPQLSSVENVNYEDAWSLMAGATPAGGILRRQRQYAYVATVAPREATHLKRFVDPTTGMELVEVELHYLKPIDLPGIGRLIGKRYQPTTFGSPWNQATFRVREIVSKCTLPIEHVQTTDQTLGIYYDSWSY